MRRLLLVLPILSCGASLGQAQELEVGLPLAANTTIEVRSFDRKTETFCVFSVKFPGEGDSFVTAAALADAVQNLRQADIVGDPNAFVGRQFQTASELATVNGAEVERGHPACTPG